MPVFPPQTPLSMWGWHMWTQLFFKIISKSNINTQYRFSRREHLFCKLTIPFTLGSSCIHFRSLNSDLVFLKNRELLNLILIHWKVKNIHSLLIWRARVLAQKVPDHYCFIITHCQSSHEGLPMPFQQAWKSSCCGLQFPRPFLFLEWCSFFFCVTLSKQTIPTGYDEFQWGKFPVGNGEETYPRDTIYSLSLMAIIT